MPILWPFKGESLVGLQGLMCIGSVPPGNTNYGHGLCFSPDGGQTWVIGNTPTPNGYFPGLNWQPLCVAYGQGIFVVGGGSNAGSPSNTGGFGKCIMYTTDGLHWTECSTPIDGGVYGSTNYFNYVYSIAFGNNIWVALGYMQAGLRIVLFSTDGINWTSANNDTIVPTYGPESRVIWDAAAGLFVITRGTNVWVSPDGSNWTAAPDFPAYTGSWPEGGVTSGMYVGELLPYLFSGSDIAPWTSAAIQTGFTTFTGQTPGPANATQWLPCLVGTTGWNYIDSYTYPNSVAPWVQAFYQDTSGDWWMGGWSGGSTTASWEWVAPSNQGSGPSALTGITQMQYYRGVYGTNIPPFWWLSAQIAQGSAPQDFYIVGFTTGFPEWPCPPYTPPVGQGSSGTGSGPTVSLTKQGARTSVLAGYEKMWVYGPINFYMLNGNGVMIAVQGSDGAGKNASPVYVFSFEEPAGDYLDWYTVDCLSISQLPAPSAAGVVGAMCGLSGYPTGGETPIEGNVMLWCWQPNGDGTYSPWSLAYNGTSTSWIKSAVSLDVQCVTGGFTTDGTNIYVTGWSPSVGGYVMKEINISTLAITDLFSSPLLSAISDGFEQSYVSQGVLAAKLMPATNLAMGPSTGQVGSIVNPVAAMAGFVVDVGSAPFAPGVATESGAWLRTPWSIPGGVSSNTVMSRYLAGNTVSLMGFESSVARLAGLPGEVGTPGLTQIWLNSSPSNSMGWAENTPVFWQNNVSPQPATPQLPLYAMPTDITYGNGIWVMGLVGLGITTGLYSTSGFVTPPTGNAGTGALIASGSISTMPGLTSNPLITTNPIPINVGAEGCNGSVGSTSFPFNGIYVSLCFDGANFWAGLWPVTGEYATAQTQVLWKSPDGENWTYVPSPYDGAMTTGQTGLQFWNVGAIYAMASSYGFPGFSSFPSVPPPVVTASPTSPVITGISATTTSVTLDWEAPSTGSVNSYEVLMSTTSNGSQSIVLTVSGSTTTGTITGLASDTEYFFQVLAVQSANNTVSNEVSTYTSGVPAGGSGTGGSSGGGTSGASGTYSDWANPYTSSFTDALSNPQAAPGSAGIVAAVVAMQVSSGYDMGVNTMSIVVVPTTQAYVSVGGGNANFSTAPIPSYASGLLNGSGDSPLVVYMPSVGAWEMWQALDNSGWTTADGAYITASQMAASTGAVAPGTGYGIAASGLSYLGTAITLADCERVINGATDFGHVIALEVSECDYHALGHVPPADRHDGGLGSGTNGYPMEGMWFYLPSGAATAPSNAFALAVYNTLMRYGCVVTDTTQGGGNYLQAEQSSDWAAQGGTGTDPFTTLLGGQATYDVLAPFSGSGSIMSHLVQIIPPLTGSPPGSAPSAPSISSVTGSSGQLAVSWSGSASMFIVAYRVTGSGAAFEVSYPDTESTSATITGLSNGTEYDVQIWAVNGSGYTASGVSTGTP